MAKDIINETEDLEDSEIITLVNDEGEEKDFLHIGTYEYNKEWFVFLQDCEQAALVEENEDLESEVYIYKLVGDEENEQLLPVEDDALAEKVYDEFMKFMNED